MSVILREKKGASGKKSLYLDIYHNNQRWYEFLKLYLLPARTKQQTERNQETKRLADNIKSKREITLQAADYDYTPSYKKKTDFIKYFEQFLKNYTNRDLRVLKCSYQNFKKFIETTFNKKTIPANQITEGLCKQFKTYLDTNLNGETPYNYFTKFKRVLKQAVKDGILSKNPATDIKNIRAEGIKKGILNIDEIQRIAQAYCSNNEIKRGFLFSLNTGLRYCDIYDLKWKNIDKNLLIMTQSKVEHSSKQSQIIIPLNKTAMQMIGKRGTPNQKIFNLPTLTGCLKVLKTWTKTAGIEKNITWHSARHSFAVNLLNPEVARADIYTVSKLLGHSAIKQTEIYLRVIDELKNKAVNRLPEIEVNYD